MGSETVKIDSKDQEIINELISNARQTVGQMSKKIGLPPTTIHNRIKKLKKSGVIMNYTVNLDYKKLQRPVLAYIGITVNYIVEGRKLSQFDIAKEIKKVDGIKEVTILTGGTDIIAVVLAKDIVDLNIIITEKLRNIDGVAATQTMIALQQV